MSEKPSGFHIDPEPSPHYRVDRRAHIETTWRFLELLLKDGSNVIDIGAGSGSMARRMTDLGLRGCSLTCVEPEEQKFRSLKEGIGRGDYKDLEVTPLVEDGNKFLTHPPENLVGNTNFVFTQGTLHHLNTDNNSRQYSEFFVEHLSRLLKTSGTALVSDYYYPPAVLSEEIARFNKFQQTVSGHKDERDCFVGPEDLIWAAEGVGLKLVDRDEIRMVHEIDKRLYFLLFQKLIEGGREP